MPNIKDVKLEQAITMACARAAFSLSLAASVDKPIKILIELKNGEVTFALDRRNG